MCFSPNKARLGALGKSGTEGYERNLSNPLAEKEGMINPAIGANTSKAMAGLFGNVATKAPARQAYGGEGNRTGTRDRSGINQGGGR